eukprot:5127216-Karenia_brevis.AAC.1
MQTLCPSFALSPNVHREGAGWRLRPRSSSTCMDPSPWRSGDAQPDSGAAPAASQSMRAHRHGHFRVRGRASE